MTIVMAWLLATSLAAQAGTSGLGASLAAEDPAALGLQAREQGDPARGAIVFHSPQFLCASCHRNGEAEPSPLGPDLSRTGQETTDAHLVESILAPSRVVKEGYETVTIAKTTGETVSGLLAEEKGDRVVLRTSGADDPLVTILKADIDERKTGGPSLMPNGLMEALASRQQFLDLVSYLREIADKGPERALALRPAASSLVVRLPSYEFNLDHAGLIADLDDESLKRGEAIFLRVCANCHGSKEQAGSMPTSMKFASGVFKNGADPLRLYATITRGFNQMPPQSWMVPKQKYDVIHYLRETYLKDANPSQYTKVDAAYLAGLPKGTDRGPEPSNIEPWLVMDYGPTMMATIEQGKGGRNIAAKGIAVRLDPGPGGVSRGHDWALYEHDTFRMAAAWSGDGFIDWQGINFDGRHGAHPHLVGKPILTTSTGPGWAEPGTTNFADPRPLDREGKPYGPLPESWAKYEGLYRSGDRAILAYRVGDAEILDMPGLIVDPAATGKTILTRTLEIGKSSQDLTLKVADAAVAVVVTGNNAVTASQGSAPTLVTIPASATPTVLKLLIGGDEKRLAAIAKKFPRPSSLQPLTKGGTTRWPEVITTQIERGAEPGPFQVDVLQHPVNNPWNSRMRLSGFDFFEGGSRAAVCDWDGDVWLVDGLDAPSGTLSWRRIASGLFQPLGLKIVDGQIFVTCRDQITILRDLNHDGETDFYECFTNDNQVTEHFHEFAMDLQTDDEGNFYYTKAARHGLKALVPQHGTLLKVSKDGAKTEILATGFRAPNGVCLNDDGTFYVTDQEGFWLPKNRINRIRPGVRFYGNMWGFHDVTDTSDDAMEQPVVWITNAMDRSPAEIIRVPEGAWGPLAGSLLNLSYGYGKIYAVPSETIGEIDQGGVSPLPITQLPTGIMRGRFHPQDKQLYACGMFAWAGTQEQPGGFYRIRYTGQPVYAPIGLKATKDTLAITFSGAIDPASLANMAHISAKTWSLVRSEKYGSEHHDEAPATIRSVSLSPDRKTLALDIPGLKPTMGMEVLYHLKGENGEPIDGVIHNTIHRIGSPD